MAEIFKTVLLSTDSVQSDAVLENTDIETKASEIRDEAYTCGFNQGMSEGIIQGSKQLRDTLHTELACLQNLLDSIPLAIQDNRLQLKSEIADIVLAIVQQLFINQQQDKETIARQISHTINHLHSKQAIQLFLHPQDIALLQQDQLKIDFSQCKNLRILPEPGLRLGGSIIRSEHGLFDAGIERQIDSLKQVLLQIRESYHE